MKIYLNNKQIELNKTSITYAEIVALAGGTVTKVYYRKGPDANFQGDLQVGGTIVLKENMLIFCK